MSVRPFVFCVSWLAATSLFSGGVHAAEFDPAPVSDLLEIVLADGTRDEQVARKCLDVLAAKLEARELNAKAIDALRPRLEKSLAPFLMPRPKGAGVAGLCASQWDSVRPPASP
ncbi:MAG: hypothetical protein QM811_14470 [Pirellulales bacterium]